MAYFQEPPKSLVIGHWPPLLVKQGEKVVTQTLPHDSCFIAKDSPPKIAFLRKCENPSAILELYEGMCCWSGRLHTGQSLLCCESVKDVQSCLTVWTQDWSMLPLAKDCVLTCPCLPVTPQWLYIALY